MAKDIHFQLNVTLYIHLCQISYMQHANHSNPFGLGFSDKKKY